MNMLWHVITNPIGYLSSINSERALISNWQDIILLKVFNRPANLRLRSGRSVAVANWKEYREFRNGELHASEYASFLNRKHQGLDLRIGKGSVNFKAQGKRLTFYYASLADMVSLINEQFVLENYRQLDVKRKTVIDIGANIGDSAVYFALKGAGQVYGFEPFPFAYAKARRNVEVNGLQKKITMLNEGCEGKRGRIRIDDKYESTAMDELRRFRKGKNVDITTLDDIVRRFGVTDGILKMDAEGAEYPIILSASVKTLRCFSQMLIEYHDYSRRLADRLRSAGFVVSNKEILPGKQGMIFVSRGRAP